MSPPIMAGLLGATTKIIAQRKGGKEMTLWGIMASLFIGVVAAVYSFQYFESLEWLPGKCVAMSYLSGTFFEVIALWIFTNYKKILSDFWGWIIRKKQ